MATKKDEWVSGNEAARIMSKNSKHEIVPDYIRLLSRQNKIRSKKIDGRTRAYFRPDVEAYRVRQNQVKEQEEGEESHSGDNDAA